MHPGPTMSAKYDSKRSKTDVLIEEGTFNPTPEKVCDPKFRGSEFFDPHDAVQVKYGCCVASP